MNEYKIKTIEFPVKDVDMEGRTIVQAFTRYNVLDADGDVGRKGMFAKTWSENHTRIKHLLNHDTTKPLGANQKFWDDNDYAYAKSKIGTHSLGDDFIKMADSGLITEASYGYKTMKESKSKEGNELLEVKQWEWSSLTAWGANQYTPIISLTKDQNKENEQKISNRIKALEKFCRNTTATDDTIELLLLEIKQLQQAFVDLTNTTQPAIAVEPELKENGLLVNRLKSINQLLNNERWQIQTHKIMGLMSS